MLADLAAQSIITGQPIRDKFEAYLESLSENDLLLIQTVMYSGRDALTMGRAYPFDEMLETMNNCSKEDRLYSILEKAYLDDYLAAGIEAYK